MFLLLLAKNSICQRLLNPGDACRKSPEGSHSLSSGASSKSRSIITDKNIITTPNTGEEYLFETAQEMISYAMICIMVQSGNSYVILLINCELMNDK